MAFDTSDGATLKDGDGNHVLETWDMTTRLTVARKAAKIQYEEPEVGYVDMPGTLCVIRDETDTFKAIVLPQ